MDDEEEEGVNVDEEDGETYFLLTLMMDWMMKSKVIKIHLDISLNPLICSGRS